MIAVKVTAGLYCFERILITVAYMIGEWEEYCFPNDNPLKVFDVIKQYSGKRKSKVSNLLYR